MNGCNVMDEKREARQREYQPQLRAGSIMVMGEPEIRICFPRARGAQSCRDSRPRSILETGQMVLFLPDIGTIGRGSISELKAGSFKTVTLKLRVAINAASRTAWGAELSCQRARTLRICGEPYEDARREWKLEVVVGVRA